MTARPPRDVTRSSGGKLRPEANEASIVSSSGIGFSIPAENQVGAEKRRSGCGRIPGVAGDFAESGDEIADRTHRVLEGNRRRIAGLKGRPAHGLDDGRRGHRPGRPDFDLAAGDFRGEGRPPGEDETDRPGGEQARIIPSRDTSRSCSRVAATPARTPDDPPVGAAQTTAPLLEACITAMARAAARTGAPPSQRLPFLSAASIFPAAGRRIFRRDAGRVETGPDGLLHDPETPEHFLVDLVDGKTEDPGFVKSAGSSERYFPTSGQGDEVRPRSGTSGRPPRGKRQATPSTGGFRRP